MHIVVNAGLVGLWSGNEGREEAILVGHSRDNSIRLRLKVNGNGDVRWVVKAIDIDYRTRPTLGGEDIREGTAAATAAATGMCRASRVKQYNRRHNRLDKQTGDKPDETISR